MYLKIREKVRDRAKDEDKKNMGVHIKWHVIPVPKDINWEWVDWISPDDFSIYDGTNTKIIFSDKNPSFVRKIVIIHQDKGICASIELIYCDDDVYLCNENGQTIERL